jgi:hypothetical protein
MHSLSFLSSTVAGPVVVMAKKRI